MSAPGQDDWPALAPEAQKREAPPAMQSRHAADLARTAAGANPANFRAAHAPVLGLDALVQPTRGRAGAAAPVRVAQTVELRSVDSLQTRRAHPRIHPSALASAVRLADFLV